MDQYATLDEFIADKSRQGWQIVSRDSGAVQMRKPKQWSRLGIAIGVLGLLVYGAGIIILLLTVADYLFQREQLGYVTIDHLRQQVIPEEFAAPSGSFLTPVLILLLILGGFTLVIVSLASLSS